MPLYRLLGLARRAVPSSLTVGINPPEVVRERVPLLLAQGARALKIKLGSPEGIAADKAMYAAVLGPRWGADVALRVDANGGWSPEDARHMMGWLAERRAEYVEQPLVQGAEDQLPGLFRDRPLPIFVDESCRMSGDIPGFADRVDGVNLKLMKCGGITEALRIVATARAHGLKTMIGCMGESSVSIAAGASIGALFDHIDLDSHLNLDPDPATGAPFRRWRHPARGPARTRRNACAMLEPNQKDRPLRRGQYGPRQRQDGRGDHPLRAQPGGGGDRQPRGGPDAERALPDRQRHPRRRHSGRGPCPGPRFWCSGRPPLAGSCRRRGWRSSSAPSRRGCRWSTGCMTAWVTSSVIELKPGQWIWDIRTPVGEDARRPSPWRVPPTLTTRAC